MKKTLSIMAILLIGSILLVGNTFALPTDRPWGGVDLTPTATGEQGLQEIFDGAFGAGNLDAIADQSDVQAWVPSYDGDVDAYAVTFYKGDAGALWIYSLTTGASYQILGDTVGGQNDFAIIQNTTTMQYALQIDDLIVDYNFGESFGFAWVNSSYGNTSYTQDYLNTGSGYGPNSDILALTYNLEGQTWQRPLGGGLVQTFNFEKDDWLIAFEDRYNGQAWGDYDFNDAVYILEDLNPVPEPATMMLLGLGLIGVAAVGRKKLMKK